MTITPEDMHELERLINEGFTSGRLDCDDNKSITWEIKKGKLKAEAWEN